MKGSRIPCVLLAPLVVSVLMAPAPAAPVPTHLLPLPPFFPSKVGTEWVYQVSGDSDMEVTETVTEAKDNDGVKNVRLRVTHKEVVRGVKMSYISIREVEVHQDGIFLVAPWPEVAGSIICLLKLPYHAGDTWEEDHPKLSLKRVCKAFKAERIKVPAGEYQAVRVETIYVEGKKENHFCNDWYVRGVGLVKRERKDINRTQVLKSFTPGKESP